MYSPRHSLGDNNTQPSTPCSASIECGGSRSTREGSAMAGCRRREPCKSAEVMPASVAKELIIIEAHGKRLRNSINDCEKLCPATHSPFTGYAQRFPINRPNVPPG